MAHTVKGHARPYDSSGRLRASRERQLRVARVAADLLVERGYAAMTVADVAAAAEVSVPWLYKAFGPKPQLVKRAYDVLLAGDPDPTPISQRPAFQALAVETDPLRAIEPYAAISRDLVSRIEPLAAALLAAGQTGEPDVAQIADAIAAERLIGATAISNRLANLGALASPLPRGARDVVWT